MTSITPDARAALAGDLRYLARQVDSSAGDWYRPASSEFMSDTKAEIRRLAALPAAAGATRERLTALAEAVTDAGDRGDMTGRADVLRRVAAQLRALSRDVNRVALVAGLRALATFLATHPDVPVPESCAPFDLSVFADGSNDDEKRAAVDATAEALGVIPGDNGGQGHYKAVRRFGPVAYESLFVSAAYHARYDAVNSYRDSVQVDEPERPALVSGECGHCAGSGFCVRPACETCRNWQEAAGDSGCGACRGSGVALAGKPAA